MKPFVLLLGLVIVTACASRTTVDPAPQSESKSPIPVYATPPMYPSEALMRGTSGWVRFGFQINGDGSVTDIRVEESEPGRLFVASARRALAEWRFDPADAGPATYTVKFELASSDDAH